jgi:hypothetical protein
VESIIAFFEYIRLNQSRGRKSTPRDLIVEPLARILGGKGLSIYFRSQESKLLSSRCMLGVF